MKTHRHIVNDVERTLNLSQTEYDGLIKSRAAKLLTAIPMAAKCKNTEKIAARNMVLMMTAHRNGVFDQKAGENIQRRLFDVSKYPGGNQLIVEYGLLLLELESLNDHKMDKEKDKGLKFNPIASEDIDYDSEVARIEDRLDDLKDICRLDDNLWSDLALLDYPLPDGEGNWLVK